MARERNCSPFFLLLWCALWAAPLLAQETLEVIPLRHRTADQVIPVLRPLLAPGGALSGQYSQLIVRTSRENLAQLRAALEAIDQPARRLMISVRFERMEASGRGAFQADARISNRGASASVAAREARSAQEARVDQRLQVLEGGQAFISAGEARVYGEAATGFAVVPRLAGGNVVLEVLAQEEAFARRGAIETARTASTVSGRLGEWLELGGASAASVRADSGALSSAGRGATQERRVWVKVEELP